MDVVQVPGTMPMPVPGTVPTPAYGPGYAPGYGVPGYGLPGFPQAGMPGLMEPIPTPEPLPVEGGQWVGNGVPIRIGFISSWEIATNYMYLISHNNNPLTIDSLDMKKAGQQGGKIQAEVTVVPMAWIAGIENLYEPEKRTTGTLAGTAGPFGVGAVNVGAAAAAPGAVPILPGPVGTPVR
jgi:hypothetical protein